MPWLSAFRLISWLGNLYSNIAKNYAIHKTFFSAFIITIYSILIEKRIIIAFYFD